MPYSPDMASMDYAINENLKTNLKRRVVRDRGQLGRAIRYEQGCALQRQVRP